MGVGGVVKRVVGEGVEGRGVTKMSKSGGMAVMSLRIIVR